MIRRLAASALLIMAMLRPHAATADSDLTYLAHAPVIASDHPPLILLLHGSGADERDMIGLWAQLPGQFVVVSPRAPFASAGGGYRWYGKATGAAREADIAISRKIIDLLVDQAIQRFGADPKRVFLAGFSQGAVMTYEVALHEPGKFRGAGVLSGSLFPSAQAGVRANGNEAESFFIAHGTADPRIPFGAATAARAALDRLHVPLEFHAYAGMRHEIGAAETRDLSDWLRKRAGT